MIQSAKCHIVVTAAARTAAMPYEVPINTAAPLQ